MDKEMVQFLVVVIMGVVGALAAAIGDPKNGLIVLGALGLAALSFYIGRRWGYRE